MWVLPQRDPVVPERDANENPPKGWIRMCLIGYSYNYKYIYIYKGSKEHQRLNCLFAPETTVSCWVWCVPLPLPRLAVLHLLGIGEKGTREPFAGRRSIVYLRDQSLLTANHFVVHWLCGIWKLITHDPSSRCRRPSWRSSTRPSGDILWHGTRTNGGQDSRKDVPREPTRHRRKTR